MAKRIRSGPKYKWKNKAKVYSIRLDPYIKKNIATKYYTLQHFIDFIVKVLELDKP